MELLVRSKLSDPGTAKDVSESAIIFWIIRIETKNDKILTINDYTSNTTIPAKHLFLWGKLPTEEEKYKPNKGKSLECSCDKTKI